MKTRAQLIRHAPGSLNIFIGKFRAKADLTKSEPMQLTNWDRSKVFYQIRRSRRIRGKFTLHDGPPYANGKIHAGHAVNKILKDIITKHKSLSGCNAPLILGWDCHGMPIEVQVARTTSHVNCSGLRLLKRARSYVSQQIRGQFGDFRRLGIMIQKEETYVTMSKPMEAEEVKMFQSLLARGLIRRDVKPLNWCFSCKSSLADAEVESQPDLKTSAYVIFPFYKSRDNYERTKRLLDMNSPELLRGISAWTTTPWTVPANKAISINPIGSYIVMSSDDGWTICSEGTVEQFARRIMRNMIIRSLLTGISVSKLKFQHPLSVLISKYVAPLRPMLSLAVRTSGTGVIHIAPAHSVDDFYQLRNNRQNASTNSITRSGYHKSALLKRRKVDIVNTAVLAWISFAGSLEGCKVLLTSVSRCARHKAKTVVRVIDQWFIGIESRYQPLPARENSLRYLINSGFVPEVGRQHLVKVIRARVDWCLSRQREWGVPIAVLESKRTSDLHPFADEMINAVIGEVKMLGIETWTGAKLLSFKRNCSIEYTKSTDTLDVWFDSGTTWNALKKSRSLSFPADLCLEGPDQHRGWFYSVLVTSVLLTGISPSKTFVTHGFVVNNEGEKLSKSAGNFGSLEGLLKRNGAEVLRLLVASVDYLKEMQITDQSLRAVGDNYKKIRNTLKFVLANLVDFKIPRDFLPTGCLVEADVYALLKVKMAQTMLRQCYDLYDFRGVVRRVVEFCTGDLGKFYLEITKDRLYTFGQESLERKSAQNALYYIANFLIKNIAPFLSFTSEEAWRTFRPDKNSVLKEYYHSVPTFNRELVTRWNTLRNIRSGNARTVGTLEGRRVIRSFADTRSNISDSVPEYYELLTAGAELKSVLSTSGVRIVFTSDAETHVIKSSGANCDKCVRCWFRPLGLNGYDDQVMCVRCKSVLQSKTVDRRLA